MELIMYFDIRIRTTLSEWSLFSQKCAQKGKVYSSKIVEGVPPSER